MEEDSSPWVQEVTRFIHENGPINLKFRSFLSIIKKYFSKKKKYFCTINNKAPKYPYPQALNDCYQAYIWILKNINKVFNVELKKIVLVGDSAGGNLVAGI